MGAGPELVAAVSGAGGFGVLGGDGRSRERILSDIERTRELTDRPFGVNFVIPVFEQPEASEEDRVEVRRSVAAAIAAQVSAIVLFWGDPAPFVEEAREHGVKVFVQVGSVEEARAASEAGVDAVIAQGLEAGGHVRGATPIWKFLPAVVKAVEPVPVLASGGIGDGAGLARALESGAQGVSFGTRFVASEEAWIHPAHKQRVVESTAVDTVVGELYDAWWPRAPHRTLRNRTFDEWEAAGRPPLDNDPASAPSSGHVACSPAMFRSGRATRSGSCRQRSRVIWSGCRCWWESPAASSTKSSRPRRSLPISPKMPMRCSPGDAPRSATSVAHLADVVPARLTP
jgi:NAD(P)H-dependent flavin oxidoreductase YrpB (nitropropane dioxygenase family)